MSEIKICGHCGQPYDINCDCIANETVAKFIYEKMQKGENTWEKKSQYHLLGTQSYAGNQNN